MSQTDSKPETPESREAALEVLGKVRFRLRVRIGRGDASVGCVLDLKEGALLPLESTPRDPVDLVCGDVLVARGEIVSADGALRFRVTEVPA